LVSYKKGDLLKHCKGFDILIVADLGTYLLYSKESSNGMYDGVDFWIRPKDMFYDKHSSDVDRFELVESLSDEEVKYIDEYAEYKRYEVARHSESLEYYVVDLVNEDLVMKI
jgi:hypothetical protein